MEFKLTKESKVEARELCHVENRVIVRIWTSGRNREIPGENAGHISIEITTPGGYMSLWPQMQPKAQAGDRGFFKPVAHEFKRDAKADDDAEACPPEIVVCLYSLNSENLYEEWNTKKDKLKGWALIGSNRLINQGEGDSCSGLAYRLLEKGGIYDQLISRGRFSSTFSSVVTPDDLAIAVATAKRIELEKCPETIGFIYARETAVDALPGKPAASSCMIL